MGRWAGFALALIWGSAVALIVLLAPASGRAADLTLWSTMPTTNVDGSICTDLHLLHVYAWHCGDTDTTEISGSPVVVDGMEGDSVGVGIDLVPGFVGALLERPEDFSGNKAPWSLTCMVAKPAVDVPITSPGLIGSYYGNKYLGGLVGTRIDPVVNFDWTTGSPFPGCPPDSFSVRWTGYITAPSTGLYAFRLHVNDAGRVVIASTVVLDDWATGDGWHDVSGTIVLTANMVYPVVIDMFEKWYICGAQLFWTVPGQVQVPVPASAWSH